MRVIQKALTFDDVLLLPAHSRVLPREVSLKTRLTRNLELNIPLVSAAMDTVTEARLAIALAREGGLGIVHRNLSIADQVADVGILGVGATVEPRERRCERGEGGYPLLGQEVLARPAAAWLEDADLVPQLEQLADDAALEVRVTVVPVAHERVDEEREPHAATTR